MSSTPPPATASSLPPALPAHRQLFYGGEWHDARHGATWELFSPGDGSALGPCADASDRDVDAAVRAADTAFREWRDTAPFERARILRHAADVIRGHSTELALIDAYDGGNAIAPMTGDIEAAAQQLEFFAGLITQLKGETIPMGNGRFNFTLRQPLGVVARIGAFNHPVMFSAGKVAAPLAAGNTVIVKPPEQAPLSTLRLAELWEDVFPRGVFNVVTGQGKETGEALVRHPGVAKVGLIGSIAAGRAVMKAASDTLKPVLLELGGKNALIGFPDSDLSALADAIVAGMNFAWCGQSCGSTSRVFLHEAIHDQVLAAVLQRLPDFKPGLPQLSATTMGAIVDARQHHRILDYIEHGKREGATLAYGGRVPDDPALSKGLFVLPTVFSDVTADMRIAREEIFGPVLSVLRWNDEEAVISQVNGLEYGLTCSIWTNDISTALRTSERIEAGYVWVNEVGRHFLSAPFGGFKQSSTGREECFDELVGFTQTKNVHVRFKGATTR
ncbi:MAG TPA: aldehyde dehydrogenase family protein [Castellaniella sp.]|nr:aldehyde dehydrogenase family protein [Castellaniella sp.]